MEKRVFSIHAFFRSLHFASCRSQSILHALGSTGENVIAKPGNRVPCSVSVSCVTCRACEAVGAKFDFSVVVWGVLMIRVLLLLLLLPLLLRPVAPLVSRSCFFMFLHVSCFHVFLFSFWTLFVHYVSFPILHFSIFPLPCAFKSQPWLRCHARSTSGFMPNLLVSHLAGHVGCNSF